MFTQHFSDKKERAEKNNFHMSWKANKTWRMWITFAHVRWRLVEMWSIRSTLKDEWKRRLKVFVKNGMRLSSGSIWICLWLWMGLYLFSCHVFFGIFHNKTSAWFFIISNLRFIEYFPVCCMCSFILWLRKIILFTNIILNIKMVYNLCQTEQLFLIFVFFLSFVEWFFLWILFSLSCHSYLCLYNLSSNWGEVFQSPLLCTTFIVIILYVNLACRLAYKVGTVQRQYNETTSRFSLFLLFSLFIFKNNQFTHEQFAITGFYCMYIFIYRIYIHTYMRIHVHVIGKSASINNLFQELLLSFA